MQRLTTELKKAGLSPEQIIEAYHVIEDWLESHYPIMAKVYHAEFLLKALPELEEKQTENRPLKRSSPKDRY